MEPKSLLLSPQAIANSSYPKPEKLHLYKHGRYLYRHIHIGGFGGLGVACWPLVPKFAGSNPAEAVGFLGRKNPQHTFLRRGSKAVGTMS